MAEEGDAKSGGALGRDRTEGGHLEHATNRSDFGLAHLRHAVKNQLERLLVQRCDGQRPAGDPTILICARQLFCETLLDPDDELVE
jgi:hypothetical protein